MATNEEQNEESRLQRLHLAQRKALNDGYSALVSQQNVQTFLAFTFEDAVDLRIEAIEGPGDSLRPSLLERVDRIENELVKAVTSLKEVPPEQFLNSDPESDVNTSTSQG